MLKGTAEYSASEGRHPNAFGGIQEVIAKYLAPPPPQTDGGDELMPLDPAR